MDSECSGAVVYTIGLNKTQAYLGFNYSKKLVWVRPNTAVCFWQKKITMIVMCESVLN